MANIGYIRVSSSQQNTARQHVDFSSAGITIDKVYEEKASGKNTERPQLKAMLQYVREGDTVYVESFSRLARSTRDLLEIVEELTSKGVQFVSLKEKVDTSTPQGKFMLTVFAGLAQLERENILQRQREGIDLCLSEGRPYGRPSVQISDTFTAHYQQWKAGEIKAVDFMRLEGLPKSTFYKLVRRFESDKKAKHK